MRYVFGPCFCSAEVCLVLQETAYETSQKYKEGMYILERAMVVKVCALKYVGREGDPIVDNSSGFYGCGVAMPSRGLDLLCLCTSLVRLTES